MNVFGCFVLYFLIFIVVVVIIYFLFIKPFFEGYKNINKKEIVKTQQPTGTQKLLEFQKELQENATEAEKIFYKYLEDHRVKFEFQKILCPNKCYIVDFFLIDYQIIVEIDGGYHDTEEQQKKDWERSLEIYRKFGYKTFRLKNSQIFSGNYEKKLINFLKKIKEDNNG